MSISVVQPANGTGTGVGTFFSDVTAGNLLVCGFLKLTSTTATVSDSMGNVWHKAVETLGISYGVSIWYAIAKASGPCGNITCNAGGPNDEVTWEVSGASVVDQTAIHNGTSAAITGACDGGTVNTTQANEFIVSVLWNTGTAYSGQSGWTFFQTSHFNGSQSVVETSLGSYISGEIVDPSIEFDAVTASFSAPGASGGSGGVVPMISSEW